MANCKLKELYGTNYLVVFKEDVPFDVAHKTTVELQEQFPDKKFVGIYNDIFVKDVSKHEIENIIKQLKCLLVK